MTHDEQVETVFLEFESELGVGEEVFLIDYTGTLNDQLRGFYRSKYTIGGEERFLAVTLFEVCLGVESYTYVQEFNGLSFFLSSSLNLVRENVADFAITNHNCECLAFRCYFVLLLIILVGIKIQSSV